MESHLTTFNFKSNHIRTVLIDDQPWFVAAKEKTPLDVFYPVLL